MIYSPISRAFCVHRSRGTQDRFEATALGRSFEEGADYRFYYAALLPAVPDDPPRSSSVIYGFLHMLHPPEHLGETRTNDKIDFNFNSMG